MRILLVDDSAALRATMSALLEEEGHEVVAAGSLASARRELTRELDLAVLDLGLDDGNGVALIPELRQTHPGIAIVVLTGSDALVTHEGVDLVLRKGGDPFALVERLGRVAQEKRGGA